MKTYILQTAIRRSAAFTACCLTGALSLLGVAHADAVKVGMILTYSGPTASLGEAIDRGAMLYVKLHGKELPPDTTVEIIKRDDTGANPDTAKRLAQELLLRDRVNILTGGQWTPNAMAIGGLIKQAKIPYVVMGAGGSAVTMQTPYVVRTSHTLWQSSYPMGIWAAKKQGYKTAYTLVSDFAPGHDAETAFVKGFTENGGKVVGSIRVPMKATDFLPYLLKIKEAAPDTVFHFNPGGPIATAFMKAMADIGLTTSKTKIIGPGDITSDEELPNMGRAALGVMTIHHYSAAATRKENVEFVAAWKKEYGADSTPNYFSVSGYDGMHAIYDTIRTLKGKNNPEEAMKALHQWKSPDSPRGPVYIDETGDIVQHQYVRRVDDRDGKLANIEMETLPLEGDPFKKFAQKP